jgi:hypothetical protein
MDLGKKMATAVVPTEKHCVCKEGFCAKAGKCVPKASSLNQLSFGDQSHGFPGLGDMGALAKGAAEAAPPGLADKAVGAGQDLLKGLFGGGEEKGASSSPGSDPLAGIGTKAASAVSSFMKAGVDPDKAKGMAAETMEAGDKAAKESAAESAAALGLNPSKALDVASKMVAAGDGNGPPPVPENGKMCRAKNKAAAANDAAEKAGMSPDSAAALAKSVGETVLAAENKAENAPKMPLVTQIMNTASQAVSAATPSAGGPTTVMQDKGQTGGLFSKGMGMIGSAMSAAASAGTGAGGKYCITKTKREMSDLIGKLPFSGAQEIKALLENLPDRPVCIQLEATDIDVSVGILLSPILPDKQCSASTPNPVAGPTEVSAGFGLAKGHKGTGKFTVTAFQP